MCENGHSPRPLRSGSRGGQEGLLSKQLNVSEEKVLQIEWALWADDSLELIGKDGQECPFYGRAATETLAR